MPRLNDDMILINKLINICKILGLQLRVCQTYDSTSVWDILLVLKILSKDSTTLVCKKEIVNVNV